MRTQQNLFVLLLINFGFFTHLPLSSAMVLSQSGLAPGILPLPPGSPSSSVQQLPPSTLKVQSPEFSKLARSLQLSSNSQSHTFHHFNSKSMPILSRTEKLHGQQFVIRMATEDDATQLNRLYASHLKESGIGSKEGKVRGEGVHALLAVQVDEAMRETGVVGYALTLHVDQLYILKGLRNSELVGQALKAEIENFAKNENLDIVREDME